MAGRSGDTDAEVLDVEAMARYLGVAPISVYRWCREGRLPAVKLGRVWRVRRAALDELLRREEQPRTLAGQLGAFLQVPDRVLALAPSAALLRRLDAAFFQAGEARDGSLIKVYGGETATPAALRDAFARHGLDARGLEAAGRLRLIAAPGEPGGHGALLREVLAEDAGAGRALWVSVDWARPVSVEVVLRAQEEVAAVAAAGVRPLVLKTAMLQEVADAWPPALQRQAQEAHQALIGLSPSRLWLSRGAPLPAS